MISYGIRSKPDEASENANKMFFRPEIEINSYKTGELKCFVTNFQTGSISLQVCEQEEEGVRDLFTYSLDFSILAKIIMYLNEYFTE